MPVATGSIAFLGATRFQGNWDAIGNDGTGSQLPGGAPLNYGTLLVDGGYDSSTLLTASQGDYWQVWRSSPLITENVLIDGVRNWDNNDWVIYSGSQWIKLSHEDTIASIIIGDLSSSSIHMGAAHDKHIIFDSGSSHSGSKNFKYDYYSDNVILTGNLLVADDKKIYFGADLDASVEYDENGTNELRFAGAAATFEQAVTFDGNVTLGNANADATTVTSQLTASEGILIADDKKIFFGAGKDASIEYNENGDDKLIISGAAAGFDIDLPDNVANAFTIGEEANPYFTVVTTNSSEAVMLSQDAWIIDDKKLYFGTGKDASIEYDEDGTNELRFAGAAVTFEQTTTFDDSVTLGATNSTRTVVLSQMSASEGILIADDKKIFFGTNKDASIEYNENGDNKLIISGAAAGFNIDLPDNVANAFTIGEESNPYLTIVTSNSAEAVAISQDAWIVDDKKLYFGTGKDAHIEYKESDDNFLHISGSQGGLVLSGSKVVLDSGMVAAIAPAPAADSFYILDATDGAVKSSTFQSTFSEVTADDGGLISVNGQLIVTGSNIDPAAVTVATDTFPFFTAQGRIKAESFADLATAMAGTGLNASGGQLGLHFAEISAVTPVQSTDSIMILDNGSSTKRVTVTTYGDYLTSSPIGGLDSTLGVLSVTGSAIGVAAVNVANDQIVFLDATGSMKRESIVDLATGMAGTGLDASSGQLTVDLSEVIASDGANELLTSDGDGTATGESNLTYDGTTFVINDDARVNDDFPLYFGTSNEAHIKYKESDDNFLHISGSSNGMVLSGSTVRVVDKLAVGSSAAVVSSAKTSGVFVVDAAADDTTNGLIATFKSGDSDYCRVNIDNSTANGDTQFTFMSNGSSKWSVGNMGSDETFHIKSGFGNFTDSDPLILTTASSGIHFTLNSPVTASQNLLIKSDKKLYFGTGKEASFEYDQDGTDRLLYAGANMRISDDVKLEFGTGGDASFEYDEDGTDRLLYAGANMRISDDVKLEFGSGGDASLEYDEDSTDTLLYAGASLRISDDVKLDFGTAGESHIQYKESDDNYMHISGSQQGIVLSGSNVSVKGVKMTVLPTPGHMGIKVGINDPLPVTSLSVYHNYQTTTFETQLSDGQGGGEKLIYSPGANDTLTSGSLYYLHTDGTWNATDADAVATGASQMLGIGLGGPSQTAGVLIKGFMRIPSTEVLNLPGSGACDGLPVYVSTTAGHFDFTAPSGTGDFVRIVGYALDDDNGDILIYFDPDKTWVEVA